MSKLAARWERQKERMMMYKDRQARAGSVVEAQWIDKTIMFHNDVSQEKEKKRKSISESVGAFAFS